MTLFHTGTTTKGAKNKPNKKGEEGRTKQKVTKNNVVGVVTSSATTTTATSRSTTTSPPPNSSSNNKLHESTTSTSNNIRPHKRSNTYTFGRNIHMPPSTEGSSSLSSSVVQRGNATLSNQAQAIDDMKQFIKETTPPSKIKYRVVDGDDISFQDTLHFKKLIKHEIKKKSHSSSIMDTTEC